MATQISTSSTADATATSGAPMVVAAPSDATLNALYFDDANGGPHLATAASPYSSWSTQGVGSATHRNAQAVATLANDNLDLFVTSPGNGPYYFTGSRSGGAWSPSAIGQIDSVPYEASTSGNGCGAWIGLDQQSRVWALVVDDVNATYQIGCDYYNGSVWTSGGAAIEGLNLGEQNRRGMAVAIIGNYLVVVYDSGSGALKYLRIDVHSASLGSWSAAAAVGSISDVTTASVLALAAIPGGSTGMLVYSGSNGISALSYDAGTDTWGSATVLSSAANDRHPTLIPGASGVVYAVWCQFAAANSYALVAKGYNGSWHGQSTLEASGNNIAWPNGTYLTSGPKLGVIWTQGTANPWSVEFDSVSPPSTGGTVSGGGSLVANALLTDTAQIVAPGTLVGNAVLAESTGAQVVAGATLQGNAILAQTGALVQAVAALVGNAALAQPNGAQIVAVAALVANALLLGPVPSTVGSVSLSASAPTCTLTAAALGTVALSAAVSE